MNDPTTALMCLDQIGRLLRQLTERAFPPPQRQDATGRLRVIDAQPRFAEVAATVLDPLRRYAPADAAIPIKMLEILGSLAAETDNADRRAVIALHAEALTTDCLQQFASSRDRRLLAETVDSLPAGLVLPGRIGAVRSGTGGREACDL